MKSSTNRKKKETLKLRLSQGAKAIKRKVSTNRLDKSSYMQKMPNNIYIPRSTGPDARSSTTLLLTSYAIYEK